MRSMGDGFILLFGTGTCGDINHIDVTKKDRLKTDYIGKTLAETVSASTESLGTVAEPEPGGAKRSCRSAASALQAAESRLGARISRKSAPAICHSSSRSRRTRYWTLEMLQRPDAYRLRSRCSGSAVTWPWSACRARSSSISVLPSRRASPFATTLVIELCQDAPGYIPTKKAFAEGSYETVNSRIVPGGGEMMAEAAIRLLKELGPQ